MFPLSKKLTGFAVLAFFAFALPAKAEVINYNSNKPWYDVSEVRLGAGVTDPTTGHETSPQITGELLLQPVGNSSWYDELRVRPHFGFSANTGGRTSILYTGATFDLFNYMGFFTDAEFGFAIHDGETDPKYYQTNHKALGSRYEFHEQVEAGYQFGDNHDYAVSAYIDHISNAGWLARKNQGLETTGIRFAKLFN